MPSWPSQEEAEAEVEVAAEVPLEGRNYFFVIVYFNYNVGKVQKRIPALMKVPLNCGYMYVVQGILIAYGNY